MTRAMKDSGIEWIGEMPSNWSLHRMKSCITDRTSGAWGNEAANNDGDTICLRVADFDYSRYRFKDVPMEDLTVRNYDNSTKEKLMLSKGDILIEKSGGGEKTPVGRTVIFDKDYPALYANFIDRLRVSDLVLNNWMQYVFVTFYKNDYSKNYIKQTTGIQNLDLTNMLASERIPVPSIDEQQRIVSFLDTECSRIDAVIEQTQASIEEYKKLKQAVITQAVTKGIRPNRPMKDSGIEWIGEIPEEWKISKIKYNFSIVSGATPKSENPDFWDGDIFWITPADFKTQDKFISHGKRNISQDGYDSCGTMLVPENSVIFSKRAPVGTVAITTNSLCTNQGCLSCVPKDKTNSIFYYYAMSVFTEQFELVSTGTTFKEISTDVFANFYLPNPPIDEQTSIANFLDTECSRIDAVIEQTQASIEGYKKLKQAVITQAVTKGIRPNRPMKDSGIEWIGEIPEDWETVQLKRIAQIQTGNTPSKNENDKYYSQYSGYLWIKAEDLGSTKPIEKTTEYLTDEGIKGARLFPPNTVFVCCIASVGKVGYCKMPASCNQQINGLIFHNVYWKYGFYFTIAQESEYINNASGNVMKIINSDKQSKLMCPLPTIEEQHYIVNYLDSKCAYIDVIISKKEKLLSELETYKKSLIYEYVTGKKEVGNEL